MLRAGIHQEEQPDTDTIEGSFNSHATRGNSLHPREVFKAALLFQFPCYAREFTMVKRIFSDP